MILVTMVRLRFLPFIQFDNPAAADILADLKALNNVFDNFSHVIMHYNHVPQQEPSLYTVKAVLILDNDGDRLYAKVYKHTNEHNCCNF